MGDRRRRLRWGTDRFASDETQFRTGSLGPNGTGNGSLVADDPAEAGIGYERRARHCGASGWRLRVGCTDGVGTAVCPRCDQLVGTRPDTLLGRPIHVILDHVA